jgi:2,3-bisphosphoglycerate-dependent phosphoglycerate mutase
MQPLAVHVERLQTPGPIPRVADTTEIILVRHGETSWNAEGRCQGIAETPLSEHGVQQLECLRDSVIGSSFDAAYMSPLRRARESAGILLRGSSLRAMPILSLREIDYGQVTGHTPGEWRRIDPGLAERWSATPWDTQFPGGESFVQLLARAAGVWEALRTSHAGERVLLVGHRQVHRALILNAAGASPRSFWSIDQPNAAIWCVRVRV